MGQLIRQQLDQRGFSEPAAVMETQRTIEHLQNSGILLVTSTGRKTLRDLDGFCDDTGNE